MRCRPPSGDVGPLNTARRTRSFLAATCLALTVMASWGARLHPASIAVTRADAAARPALDDPEGLELDATGTMYVADSAPSVNRVVSISSRGNVLASWGPGGTKPGEFGGVTDVAVDPHHTVYVVLLGDNTVEKLSPSGHVVVTWGSYGSKPGQFSAPQSVATDRRGNVYVADSGNNRIQELSPRGQVLHIWGKKGTGPAQFSSPQDIVVDPHGNMYVADFYNNRIQELSPGGKFVRMWGKGGSKPGEFDGANSVAVDRRGDVYAVDLNHSRLEKFSPSGRLLGMFGQTRAIRFGFPQYVAVGPNGDVYVTDHSNTTPGRIVTLSPQGKLLAILPKA